MEEVKLNADKVSRAYLVGVQEAGQSAVQAQEHLDELASLSDTMGVEVAGSQIVHLGRPTPHFYLGAGKAEEIKRTAAAQESDVLIFDVELSPSQQRNWEEFAGIAVIDRQEVILDIFASRARTKEARLQVGLARMEYSLPRLRRAWTHLERQRGGAGMRGGPGELQLEVDRRVVMDRIRRFKQQLAEVRKQREVQRKGRRGRPVPSAAIVGYTNVGKSSLLNRLAGADVFIEDKLFATLDPTTRRILLPNNQPLLLTDTVGFIRKLPHQLVESFKATLEEARLSDFLIHVLDVSHPKIAEHYETTNQVLGELGASDKLTILVFNKIDRPHDPFVISRFRRQNPRCFPVSTVTGAGLDELVDAFARHFVLPMRRARLQIPLDRFDLVDLLHREGDVRREEHRADGVWIEAEYPLRYAKNFMPYVVRKESEVAE